MRRESLCLGSVLSRRRVASMTAGIAVLGTLGAATAATASSGLAGDHHLSGVTQAGDPVAEHERMHAAALDPAVRARAERMMRAARADAELQGTAVPSADGAWAPPFSIPTVGIHSAVLPTGKVMWFGRPQTAADKFQITIWDPATGVAKRVAPPLIDGKPVNFFCGGQSFLADGRLLVTGGQIAGSTDTTTDSGLKTVYTFNPFNETWTRQPDMAEGRWYPTQVLLPDGRTVIMAGKDSSGRIGAPHNNDIEVFTPSSDLDGVGTVTLLGERGVAGGPPIGGLYPHLFTMPSGRTLVAAPRPEDSWFLNSLGTGFNFSWTDVPNPVSHPYANGVILPKDTAGSTQVALIGGGRPATTGVDVFDEANPAGGWAAAPSLNVPRTYGNTVMLPDGSMAAIGGGPWATGGRSSDFTAANLAVELYDPSTRTWRVGAAQAEGRVYHSTAVLLPDGRVVSAGDDTNGGYNVDTAEIYSPPYLFKGARPAITAAPASVGYGQSFSASFAGSDVAKAVLVAPSAVTHSIDMSQRYVPLAITGRTGGSVTVSSPANANLAPPGYYMLFLVNAEGVPSVAKFVRLGGGTQLPTPAATPAPGPAPPQTPAPTQTQTTPKTPAPTAAPASDATAPRLQAYRLSRRTFRAARRGGVVSVRRVAGGTQLRLVLSERSTVAFSLRGRRGTTRVTRPQGLSSLWLTGRSGNRALPKGRHQLLIKAVDAAGNSSQTARLSFRIR